MKPNVAPLARPFGRNPGSRIALVPSGASLQAGYKPLFLRSFLAFPSRELVHGRGNAGAAAQRFFEADWAPVLFQEVREGFVGQFVERFHLVAREKIERGPGFGIELYAFAD